MFVATHGNTFHQSHRLLIKVASKLRKSTATITKHELLWDSLLHENCSIPPGDHPKQIFILQKQVRTYR